MLVTTTITSDLRRTMYNQNLNSLEATLIDVLLYVNFPPNCKASIRRDAKFIIILYFIIILEKYIGTQ